MLSLLRQLKARLTGWRRPRAIAPVQAPPFRLDPGPRAREGLHFATPQDQLDVNEWLEAEQSRQSRQLHVSEVGQRTAAGRTVRRLTAEGVVTEEIEVLLQACYGGIIAQEELVGGGRCVCGGYADRDHFVLCQVCGAGLCVRHAFPVEGIWLCPDHARWYLDHRRTWGSGEPQTRWTS